MLRIKSVGNNSLQTQGKFFGLSLFAPLEHICAVLKDNYKQIVVVLNASPQKTNQQVEELKLGTCTIITFF